MEVERNQRRLQEGGSEETGTATRPTDSVMLSDCNDVETEI